MTFGERLKEIRENKGYKQNQFADMLGITATRLNYWEKDKREPDVAMIKKISLLLEVSSDWLIGNDEYANKKLAPDKDEKQQKLIDNYNNLNQYGKDKLLDYSDDLVGNEKYIKTDTDIKMMNA